MIDYPKFRFILLQFSQVYRVLVGERCIGIVKYNRRQGKMKHCWTALTPDETIILDLIVSRTRAAQILWQHDQGPA